MAYKINGTTVVDNSRNVCACCVTSCCITASDRMDAPSGTTAQRPSSPATGSIYFDTDEGSLISYNGTDWASVGGSSAPDPDAPNTLANDKILIGYAEGRDDDCCRGVCGCIRYFNHCFNSYQLAPCAMWMHGCNNNWCCATCALTFGGTCFVNTHCVTKEDGYQTPACGNVFCQLVGQCCFAILPNVYPDGSIQLFSGRKIPGCCFNFYGSRFKDFFINKFGGMQQHTGYMPSGICNQSGYCIQRTSECAVSAVYPLLNNHGLCNPVLNACGNICKMLKGSFCKTPDTYANACWVYEVKGDLKNLNNAVEICEIAFSKCTQTTSTSPEGNRNRFTQSKKATNGVQFNNSCKLMCLQVSNPCTSLNNCYCGGRGSLSHNLVSKCPTWDYTSPDSYTKNLWTVKDGICLFASTEHITNSLVISRNVGACTNGQLMENGWHGPFSNNRTSYCQACTAVSFITNDGCKLVHMYANQHITCQNCIFQKTTVNTNCCCAKHCNAPIPAVEVIDLVNGCVECSVYFCRICDGCRGATVFPECILCNADPSMDSFDTSGPKFHCSFCSPAYTQKYHGIALGDEFADGSSGAVIKSCSCDGHFYVLGNLCCGKQGFGRFNLCDMKWDYFKGFCHFQLNSSCGLCFLKEFSCSVCGTCTSSRHQCICSWMCNCFEACTGLCYRNTSGGCSFFETFVNSGAPDNMFCCCHIFRDVEIGGKNTSSTYINAYTEHLVRLVALSKCVNAQNHSYVWIGAICYDMKNGFCISAVDTIFPNEGEKCIHALQCSLCCWCDPTFTYACRGNERGMVCTIAVNSCCPNFTMVPYGVRGSTTGSGNVFTFINGDQPHGAAICSSCRYCPACPSPYGGYCCGSYLGYFGPCCYGGDIKCNTGCNACFAGLESWKIRSSIAKIPHCTPIGCSNYASRDPAMKYLIETLHGLTDLSHAWSCCNDDTTRNFQRGVFNRHYYGGTLDTVDITCQYSLGCTEVYTWGKNFCSKQRWVVENTCDLFVCFCSCVCNCYGGYGCGHYCMRYCDIYSMDRCNCFLCAYPCYPACLNCAVNFDCKACHDAQHMPTALKGISASTVTNGGTDASVISRGNPYYDNINFYDDTIINPDYGVSSNDRQNGWVNHSSTTCFEGVAGMLHEWFNKNYACIC